MIKSISRLYNNWAKDCHILSIFLILSCLLIISNFSCSNFCLSMIYLYFSQIFDIISFFCVHFFIAIFFRASLLILFRLFRTVKWFIISEFLHILRHLAYIEQTVLHVKKNMRSRCEILLRSAEYKMQSQLIDHFNAPPILTLFLSLGQIHLIQRVITSQVVVLNIEASLSQNRIPSLIIRFFNLVSSYQLQ